MSYTAKPIRFSHSPGFPPRNLLLASEEYEQDAWLPLHKMIGDTLNLYHYTDYNGLMGILNGRSLYATHFAALNDPQEIRYGKDIVLAEIKRNIEESENGSSINRYYQALERYISATFGNVYVNLFATCFCEDGDLLSQWRGYGTAGKGYSIGFKFDNTVKRLTTSDKETYNSKPAWFRKVIYNKSKQVELVSNYLKMLQEAVMQDFKATPDPRGIAPTVLANVTGDLLVDFIMTFKSEAFKAENEWRLIHAAMPNYEPEALHFMNTPTGLKSYRVNHVYNEDQSGSKIFPCHRVLSGPALDPIQSRLNLNLLSYSMEKSDHDIKMNSFSAEPSKFAFR